MKRVAVYPGTFDPVTKGHIDIIKRSLKLFDRIVILVAERKEKHTLFTLEERVEMVKRAVKRIQNVEVDLLKDQLLVDYIRTKNVRFIVRGLRSVGDFDYELNMTLTNRELFEDFETVFIVGGKGTIFLSSTLVREIIANKGDFAPFVPREIHAYLRSKLGG